MRPGGTAEITSPPLLVCSGNARKRDLLRATEKILDEIAGAIRHSRLRGIPGPRAHLDPCRPHRARTIACSGTRVPLHQEPPQGAPRLRPRTMSRPPSSSACSPTTSSGRCSRTTTAPPPSPSRRLPTACARSRVRTLRPSPVTLPAIAFPSHTIDRLIHAIPLKSSYLLVQPTRLAVGAPLRRPPAGRRRDLRAPAPTGSHPRPPRGRCRRFPDSATRPPKPVHG